MRVLLDEIIANTNNYYQPPKLLALDESMIKFNGRSRFKVYMPLKPIKFGFKVYTIVPSQAPIVLNMSIYDGKKRTIVETVSELMDPFQDRGYTLYMDRFYSSPQVFKVLQGMGIGAVGTCMSNRLQFTDDFKTSISQMIPNEYRYFQSNEMLLTIWRDSKIVYLLSTVDQIRQTRVTRRKRKANITEENSEVMETINMPSSIFNYNRLAKGVDILDQYLNYYLFPHRSMKWYFRIAIYMLEIAIVNSWVLYKESFETGGTKILSYFSYRRAIAKSLIKDLSQSRIIPQTPIKTAKKEIRPNAENPELWGKCHLGKGNKRYCHYCKKRQTRYTCAECEVPLCDIPCYDMHLHGMKNKILLI